MPNSLSVILMPGFMLDDALWSEMLPCFPKQWSIYKAKINEKTSLENIDKIANDQHLVGTRHIVIGFSFGGYLARAYAQRFPDQVLALILIASSQRVASPPKNTKQRNESFSKSQFAGLSLAAIRKSLAPTQERNDKLVEYIQAMGRRLGGETYINQLNLDRNVAPLKNVRYPTLVIAAEYDRIRSLEESVELVSSIPNAELTIIPNTGHMIPLEQPATLLRCIVQWLDLKIEHQPTTF